MRYRERSKDSDRVKEIDGTTKLYLAWKFHEGRDFVCFVFIIPSILTAGHGTQSALNICRQETSLDKQVTAVPKATVRWQYPMP